MAADFLIRPDNKSLWFGTTNFSTYGALPNYEVSLAAQPVAPLDLGERSDDGAPVGRMGSTLENPKQTGQQPDQDAGVPGASSTYTSLGPLSHAGSPQGNAAHSGAASDLGHAGAGAPSFSAVPGAQHDTMPETASTPTGASLSPATALQPTAAPLGDGSSSVFAVVSGGLAHLGLSGVALPLHTTNLTGSGLLDTALGSLQGALGTVQSTALTGVFGEVLSRTDDAVTGLTGALSNLPAVGDTLHGALGQVNLGAVQGVLQDVVQAVNTSAIGEGLQGATASLSAVTEAAQDLVSPAMTPLLEAAADAVQTVAAAPVVQQTADALSPVTDTAQDAVAPLAEAAGDVVESAVPAPVSEAAGAVPGVSELDEVVSQQAVLTTDALTAPSANTSVNTAASDADDQPFGGTDPAGGISTLVDMVSSSEIFAVSSPDTPEPAVSVGSAIDDLIGADIVPVLDPHHDDGDLITHHDLGIGL